MVWGYEKYKSVVGRYADRAYTVALRLTGDEEAAEALTAEAFATAYDFYGGSLFMIALCRKLLAGTAARDTDEAALYLRICMELDYKSIAVIMECEPQQVRCRIAAARDRLCRDAGMETNTARLPIQAN